MPSKSVKKYDTDKAQQPSKDSEEEKKASNRKRVADAMMSHKGKKY